MAELRLIGHGRPLSLYPEIAKNLTELLEK